MGCEFGCKWVKPTHWEHPGTSQQFLISEVFLVCFDILIQLHVLALLMDADIFMIVGCNYYC